MAARLSIYAWSGVFVGLASSALFGLLTAGDPCSSSTSVTCHNLVSAACQPTQHDSHIISCILSTTWRIVGVGVERHTNTYTPTLVLMSKRKGDDAALEDPQKKTKMDNGSINGGTDGEQQLDENLHSRQLAVYGREVMRKMAGSSVLVSGANGVGVEIGEVQHRPLDRRSAGCSATNRRSTYARRAVDVFSTSLACMQPRM